MQKQAGGGQVGAVQDQCLNSNYVPLCRAQVIPNLGRGLQQGYPNHAGRNPVAEAPKRTAGLLCVAWPASRKPNPSLRTRFQVHIPMVQTVQRRACGVLEGSASTCALAISLSAPEHQFKPPAGLSSFSPQNSNSSPQPTYEPDVPRQVEVPQLQYEDQVVHIPVQKQVHVPMVQQVQRRAPQCYFCGCSLGWESESDIRCLAGKWRSLRSSMRIRWCRCPSRSRRA